MSPKTVLYDELESGGRSKELQRSSLKKRKNVAMKSIKRKKPEKRNKDLSQNPSTATDEQKMPELKTMEGVLIIIEHNAELIYLGENGYLNCFECIIERIRSNYYHLVLYSCHKYDEWSGSFLFRFSSLRSLKHSGVGSIFKRLCILDKENNENKLCPSFLDSWLVEFEHKPKIYSKWHFSIYDYLKLKNTLLIRCHSSAQRHQYNMQIKSCEKRVDTLQKRLKNDITFSVNTKRFMSVVANAKCTRLSLHCLSLLSENITSLLHCKDKSHFIEGSKVKSTINCVSCIVNDKDDAVFSKSENIPQFKKLNGNRTVSEEDNYEQQENVSDSKVHATKRLREFCTKLQDVEEPVEHSFQNLNDQNRECTKNVSLKNITVDLKLIHERPRFGKSEFSREKNDDVEKEKLFLHPYTRSMHFEFLEPMIAIVNPVFRKENESKDTQSPSDDSCSEQEPESRRETSPIDNNEAESHTIAAAALPLDASYSQDKVGIDGHVSTPNSLRKQVLEVIPKVSEANDVRTASDLFAREGSVHNTARDDELPNPNVDNGTLQGFEPLMGIIDKIAKGQSVPPQVTMRYEMLRLCTLRSYPTENKPYKTRLAEAGFYYAKNGDEVVCYCCGYRKRNWIENDRPMDIHRELNPNCSFLLRNSEVNVPVRDSSFAAERSRAQTHQSNTQQLFQNHQHAGASQSSREAIPQSENDYQTSEQCRVPHIATTGHLAISSGYRAKERISHGNFVQVDMPRPTRQEVQLQSSGASFSNSNPVRSSQSDTGAVTHVLPKYPKFASITVRLTSFNDCGDIVVRPESLAEAGFFYAGFGDCVRCFHCGVGLRHWSEEDDPWIEHSRWAKDCSFVRQVRGQEFVRLVQMAVQYSQGQNGNQQSQNEFVASSNLGTNGDEIDKLLHTNAAQSVLEMGYEPNIIRKAIRLILDKNGKAVLTASNLMEKIFEIEESEATPSDNDQTNLASPTTGARSGTAGGGSLRGEGSSASLSSRQSTSGREGASLTGNASGPISASLSGSASQQEHSRNIKRSLGSEQKRLKEENEKLKMQSICTKCKKRDVSIVFLPCGHLVTCEECAPTVKYCTIPSCGRYIKGTVRTYVS